MALWTPYAQEAALDLSKPAVKVETASPLPASCAPHSPLLSEPYPESVYHAPYMFQPASYPNQPASYPYQPASHPCQSASYPHQPVYSTEPSLTSPDSIASWSHNKPLVPSPPESAEFYDSLSDDAEYQAFERDAMRAMAEKNGGTLLGNNPRMRRAVQTSQTADDSYRKQRERNNIAAKQSRDRRKLREMRLALETTYLKKKIAELRAKLSTGVCGRCRQTYEC